MTRPLRVLMLLEGSFPPDVRVENEAASLLDDGHDVHLLCGHDARTSVELPPSLERLVVHAVDRPAASRRRPRIPNLSLLWFHDARWARRIEDLSGTEGGFDVVHVHDLPLVRTAQRVAERTGGQVVADLHENYPMVLPAYVEGRSLSPVARFLLDPARWERHERATVPRCSGVIAVTDRMRDRLIGVGVDPSRIAVVENLVDSERFLAYPVDHGLRHDLRDRFVITYVGGFVSNRGLDTTIRAMSTVIRRVPEALLVLVGAGGTREQLAGLSREIGVEDHVRFEGWVDFSRIPSYLAASDVCVAPLLRSVQTDAALSHKLFQYMLMGKPVVASTCIEMTRVVRETGCGLLFPPGDSDALAGCLVRLAGDPELRARLGENGRRAALDRYIWPVSEARLIALYERLQRVRVPAGSGRP